VWLRDDELRVALGCMRLSTEPNRDDERGIDTIVAALESGITILDSAHAYALDDDDKGHNERLIARAVAKARVDSASVRVVTKGGMLRPDGKWRTDGRARTILRDCDAARAALDGLAIDLYLLHAPDPDVDFGVSVRALASLLEKGHVKRVGLSNVTRTQLDEAMAIVPISAVEAQLSWFDASALDNGVLARCIERDIPFLAHRPLGGVKKQRTIARDKMLSALANKHATSNVHVALAAVLDLHPLVIAVPGTTSPTHARDVVARVALDDDDRAQLASTFDKARVLGPRAPTDLADGEVVMLMGLQGAGKTDALSSWLARGYERINRDELGGTMRSLHQHLDARLRDGSRKLVLDNTYLERKTRREAIETAWKHRVPVRGVWHDIELVDAQVNMVLRMLRAHGRLLDTKECNALGGGPDALPPHAQHRSLQRMERPSLDEGYASLDVVTFARRPGAAHLRAATFIAFEVVGRGLAPRSQSEAMPCVVFAWRPSPLTSVRPLVDAAMDVVECTHGAGPPLCWCRPPLPGLLLAWSHAHDVDPRRSTLIGITPTHRALAKAIGATFVLPDERE
jgi:aryl-alcohol dehydrogenase-like predicted oxidoreductase